MKKILLLLFGIPLVLACSQSPNPTKFQTGDWTGFLQQPHSEKLPFKIRIEEKGTGYVFALINGLEIIEIPFNLPLNTDSITLDFPIYNTQLKFAQVSESEISGYFLNHDGNYRLPFTAFAGFEVRFKDAEVNPELNSRYKITFYPGTEKSRPAIGEFSVEGNKISGSIITETGDYRFLNGNTTKGGFKVSTFDGKFVYLFTATQNGDSLQGTWYSGKAEPRKWVAIPDAKFQLRDADSLTFLKPGFEEVAFSFPDVKGNEITTNKETQLGKVTIIQIMGSWCPNCKDETHFLKSLYQKHKDKGLEIVGLTFEYGKTQASAERTATKMVEDLEIPYPIALAGQPNAENTAKALPMLNKVMSYPTAIYIDKKGEVRKIHTGFTGPGTQSYTTLTEDLFAFVESLLAE